MTYEVVSYAISNTVHTTSHTTAFNCRRGGGEGEWKENEIGGKDWEEEGVEQGKEAGLSVPKHGSRRKSAFIFFKYCHVFDCFACVNISDSPEPLDGYVVAVPSAPARRQRHRIKIRGDVGPLNFFGYSLGRASRLSGTESANAKGHGYDAQD